MELTISTTADNGHMMSLLIDSQGRTLLIVRDTQTEKTLLMPGERYTIQWTVWSPFPAQYSFTANMDPAMPGFPIVFSHQFDEAKKTSGIEVLQA